MKMQSNALSGAVAALAIALAGPFATAAAGSPSARVVAVRYGDLDLASQQGRQKAYSRLRAAARRVCGYYDPRDIEARLRWRTCYRATLDDAVTRLGNAELAALHDAALQARR